MKLKPETSTTIKYTQSMSVRHMFFSTNIDNTLTEFEIESQMLNKDFMIPIPSCLLRPSPLLPSSTSSTWSWTQIHLVRTQGDDTDRLGVDSVSYRVSSLLKMDSPFKSQKANRKTWSWVNSV